LEVKEIRFQTVLGKDMTKMTCAERRAKWRQGEPLTMTVPEAGWRYFGLSENGSYAAVRRGDIPVIKVGGHMRVPRLVMDQILRKAATHLSPTGPAAVPNGRAAAPR
jgi:hypothetical protein